MLGRQKKLTKKKQQQQQVREEEARKKALVSAQERAYLDRLERMIETPGQSPYIQRNARKKESTTVTSDEPLYDSGPMTADQMQGRAAGAVAPDRERRAVRSPEGRVRLGADGVYEIELDVPSADLEQYDDVKPRPPREPKPSPRPRAPEKPVEPEPTAEPETAPPHVEEESKDLFPCGALVVWNDGELAIYKEHREEKGYDVVYVAESGGTLVPKGVCLFAYGPRVVGRLSEPILRWMERCMRWDRNAFVAHFHNPTEADKVPVLREAPSPGEPEFPPPPAEPVETGPFVRGRTFTITMGDHRWHAVYWGRDTIGTLVAHNTNRVWTLMHLDLDRFGADLQLGDVLPAGAVAEIERAVNGQG